VAFRTPDGGEKHTGERLPSRLILYVSLAESPVIPIPSTGIFVAGYTCPCEVSRSNCEPNEGGEGISQ